VAENRVQEALAKQAVTAEVPVEWHLIGPLQRNKVRQILGRFALLHAVDRPELVAELAKRVPRDQPQAILLEVNCSGEAQKAGVSAEGLPGLIDLVLDHPQLDLRGLMTMAPLTRDEMVQRKVFRQLQSLRDAMQQRGIALPELSMGMSGDYPVAVEEGATMVRLGTVLFGERTS
jgi:PLP dependent protein